MNAVHLFLIAIASIVVSAGHAATIDVIGPENRFTLSGKEADWIDGDFVIRNDEIVAVIARPGELRDANMTVRGVGACIIDLTRVDAPSDQLSCFYPGAGRFQFYDDTVVEQGTLEGGGVFWRCKSSSSLADGQDSISTIEYQLRIKLSVIECDLSELKLPAKWSVAESGVSIIHLPSGTYKLRAEAIGHETTEVSPSVNEQPSETSIVLGAASRIVGKFTDDRGGEIPCKATIYGGVSADGTKPTTQHSGWIVPAVQSETVSTAPMERSPVRYRQAPTMCS